MFAFWLLKKDKTKGDMWNVTDWNKELEQYPEIVLVHGAVHKAL